jgi:hypothetical protein
MSPTTKKKHAVAHEPVTRSGYVIVDLGKKSRAAIRDLRKGEGKLFAEIDDILTRLKTDGVLKSGTQPVFVVEEKSGEELTSSLLKL